MKIVIMAALTAAQFPAVAPAQSAELPREETAAQSRQTFAGLTRPSVGRSEDEVKTAAFATVAAEPAPVAARTAAAEEGERKKGKSTGDKILTGAAVVLAVGALAVGGLLVAIFAN